ncbi:MAG TPA: M48 family metallopeptidase [Candidatus Nanoarchaeia archaeon]|nr:M48 family metallopeptidase [Candidatus Nanoarchaeia archaeon]
MKPPHLAINDEVSKEAVSQLRTFSMQKFRPEGRGFTPSEIFCIKQLNEKYFKFYVGKIFLKYNASNWGSCSNSGNINISTRIIFAPGEIIDYVCIHELAHLQEKNHSPKFWKLVEQALPDYKEKQKWLKENSDKCWF